MKPAGSRDFRDLRRKGDKTPATKSESNERRWWDFGDGQQEDCAQSVRAVVETLKQNQQARMRQQIVSARLYGNLSIMGAASSTYARLLTQATAAKDRVTYNVVQSTTDTLVARVGENKPRPYFLTSGGNYRQQRRAKKLNQFIEGVFYETKTYDLGLQAFRDGAIWGDGFVHVFGRGGKICHERVLGAELWVDEVEAQYGFPRNMHRVKLVDKDELAAYFPEHREAILDTPRDKESAKGGLNVSEMVRVVESWHLGAPDEKGEIVGGKHCISLPDSSLMLVPLEEWPYDFFPFARFPWCERPIGYWSQGLAEQLQGIQLELNKELWLIQRSMHLAGSFKVFVKNGSKVVKEELNNDIGTVVTYTGDQPQYVVPQPIHEVYFANSERLIQRAEKIAGVSELATGAKKPAGLNSGKALREFQDIESDRHRTTQRANDNLYLQIAALDIAIARELSKTGKLEPVRVPGKNAFAEINFKKDIGASLKDSEFVMQCFPVSRLPRDPSGRLQTIQEYIQAGMITLRQGRRALDFADLDSIESLANAQEDLATKILDDIVDEGKYTPPEPTDDLVMLKEMVIEYIQRYRLLELEDEKLELLRNFNSQIDMLQDMAAQAMTPPPGMAANDNSMAAPGGPQAVPAPPPVSDLLPNAPGAVA